MFRLATSIFALAAAIGPSVAADWGKSPEDIYREAYSIEPHQWSEMGDQNDGIHIETGLRYWYSMGSQSHDLGSSGKFEEQDSAHSVELHLRIEEDATSTYAKAWVGYTAAITGTYSDPYGSADVVDGTIGYGGADFGWNALSNNAGTGVGGFFGYNYWQNSPRTDRANFAIIGSGVGYDSQTGVWSVGGDSVDDKIELHMLRLGLSGKAELGNNFDISAEVAAVPFASISGVIGGHAIGDDPGMYPGCPDTDPTLCAPYFFKTSATNIEGWGYGAMGELMAGFKPMDNLMVRLGGRAWYVQGTYDATFSGAEVTPPIYTEVEDPDNPGNFLPANPPYSAPSVSRQNYIETENPFSLFRYGLLAEITYSF